MFMELRALSLLRKLDWEITIDSLLSFVKSKGYSIKICSQEEYEELVECAADNILLWPNSLIIEIDGGKVLVLKETHSNIDILVQIAHILLRHKVKNDIRGNTGKENKEALLFAGLVLKPNNSLLKVYRNTWGAFVVLLVFFIEILLSIFI